MTNTEQKHALFNAANECSTMILQAENDNSAERHDHGYDGRRLARYEARRAGIVQHRTKLEDLYVSLYNENPWANVPYRSCLKISQSAV